MTERLKIGQEVLIHGYVDEIRKDTVIIRNEGGYFGTVECEITDIEMPDTNEVLDKIRAEIESYEADCILADDSKECKECDKIVFGSIYRIIDKYRDEQEEVDDWRDRLDELEREEYYESKYGKEQE